MPPIVSKLYCIVLGNIIRRRRRQCFFRYQYVLQYKHSYPCSVRGALCTINTTTAYRRATQKVSTLNSQSFPFRIQRRIDRSHPLPAEQEVRSASKWERITDRHPLTVRMSYTIRYQGRVVKIAPFGTKLRSLVCSFAISCVLRRLLV